MKPKKIQFLRHAVLTCLILHFKLTGATQTFTMALDQGGLSSVSSSGFTGDCGGGTYETRHGYSATVGGTTMSFHGQGSILSSDLVFYPSNSNSSASCGAFTASPVSGSHSYTWRISFSSAVHVASVYVNRIGGADLTNKVLRFHDGNRLLEVDGDNGATSFSNATGGSGSNFLLNWNNVTHIDIIVLDKSHADFSIQMQFGDIVLGTTLPVIFSSFSAAVRGQGVLLQWSTASEYNSSHFVLERTNGFNLIETIGTVQARGGSGGPMHYQFTDTKPIAGRTIYRIKAVDPDSSFRYSAMKAISYLGGTKSMLFLTNDRILIPAAYTTTNGIVELLDIMGRVVFQKRLNSSEKELEFNKKRMPPGIYVLCLTDYNTASQLRSRYFLQ